MENFLINVVIFFVIVIGFFWYWGKNTGAFKEGGIVNDWWKNYRAKKKAEKQNKNDI